MTTRRPRVVRKEPAASIRREKKETGEESMRADPQRVIAILCAQDLGKALWERAVAVATNEMLVEYVNELKENQAIEEEVSDEE